MNQFLTVKDATKFVSKSESTIKRLLREITAEAEHPDRSYIQPSHDEVEARKAAAEPYVWKINKALLLKRYPQDDPAEEGTRTNSSSSSSSDHTGSHDVIISVLREQLQSKDRQLETLEKQLDRKDEQIGHQNERMREQNVLMKDLQQRLAITAPSKPDVVVESTPQESTQDPDSNAPESKAKTSFWLKEFRLFGRR